MSELLFYGKTVPLNREKHKNLKFKPLVDLSFSKHANSVPVAGIEFFEASRDLAILFTKSPKGDYGPVALLSLRNDGHDMVTEEGKWRGQYIPGFIRRYPFGLTENGTVCLDETCPAFSEKEGEPLFDGDKSTEQLDRVVNFLQAYDADIKRTRAFCEALKEQDMLIPFDAQVGGGSGGSVRLQGLYAIDDKKFAKLSGETLEQWFQRGWVGWVFAHLHSLGALRQLPRPAPKPDAQPEAANSPEGEPA
ncbi:SapC family protein [Gilvimarinus sp. F26214L]|uniref:SapC family protein n=1 Tax=Gilvimarinus sp. DZF01 TaxID=3461371 RepID=UPI0040456265